MACSVGCIIESSLVYTFFHSYLVIKAIYIYIFIEACASFVTLAVIVCLKNKMLI